MAASKSGRLLSTSSNKGDGTLGDKPASVEKILVFGGNGFVSSHIFREALERGLTVHSLSRSGKPSHQDSWTNSIVWHQGDLLSPDSLKSALTGVTSVVSVMPCDMCLRMVEAGAFLALGPGMLLTIFAN